jgi:hypothetical protein
MNNYDQLINSIRADIQATEQLLQSATDKKVKTAMLKKHKLLQSILSILFELKSLKD